MKKALILVLAATLLAACAQQSGPDRDAVLTDTPQYGKFIWHDLLTDDVDAAKAFYGPLLGWTFERATRPGGGPYTLIKTADGSYVGGILEVDDPGDGNDYSRWLGYYAVPEVDKAANAFAEAGGEILVAPRELGTVARAAVVQDPDGAVVGLINSKIGYPVDAMSLDDGDVASNELVTGNPATAAALYAEVSASSVGEKEEQGVLRFVLSNDGRDRAQIHARPDERLDPLWLTFFAAQDPGRVASRAEGLGGAVVLSPSAEVRGGSLALVTDPTGAVFGVLENR